MTSAAEPGSDSGRRELVRIAGDLERIAERLEGHETECERRWSMVRPRSVGEWFRTLVVVLPVLGVLAAGMVTGLDQRYTTEDELSDNLREFRIQMLSDEIFALELIEHRNTAQEARLQALKRRLRQVEHRDLK